jgi:two-component system chemotaxis sensor kinase CheA
LSTVGSVDQFRHSFCEEARDVLVDLESALLELNENRADAELVGRVFRGLHTLKGSGAMFGFDELAAFTHNLETAFDEVRNGRLAISSELIDLTLTALDRIRVLLDDNAEKTSAEAGARAEILARVGQMIQIQRTGASTAPVEALPAPLTSPAGATRDWHIRFAPGADMMRTGADPFLLLRELGLIGGMSILASMAAVPALSELDPERCYVSWEMVLATGGGQDAIRDVFIFVDDCCDLTIAPADSSENRELREPMKAEAIAKALEEPRVEGGGRRTYDNADNASSLRVPAAKLDQFVNLVGELVTVQARMSELAARRDDPEVAGVAEEIERLTSALRENSMNIRMTPIRGTFEKFRRLVHDLARDLGKDVELSIEGADTELDKTVIDQLGDPLMHLIRNSMDHGIEPPSLRTARGKRSMATIHLSARHSGASVLIGVSDDGGGIDVEAVRQRAIEKGLIDADAPLTEREIFALLFQPGFSTAKKVTDVSGRGVGMDVVRQRVDSLRGSIDVASKPGLGTSVTLRLPLTLAIIDGLLVNIGDACFVLPLQNILECIELTRADIERANGKHMANVRGEIVPYIRLREHFQIHTPRPEIEQIMVVQTEQGRYGFVVDQVLGNCQTVIKNLGRFYRHVQVVSGATILGNGTVALILDPERLAQDAVRANSHASRGSLSLGAQNGRSRDSTVVKGIQGFAGAGGKRQRMSNNDSTS